MQPLFDAIEREVGPGEVFSLHQDDDYCDDNADDADDADDADADDSGDDDGDDDDDDDSGDGQVHPKDVVAHIKSLEGSVPVKNKKVISLLACLDLVKDSILMHKYLKSDFFLVEIRF